MKPDDTVEHQGGGRDPDWIVERLAPASYRWRVTDWTGEIIAWGVCPTRDHAIGSAMRWAPGCSTSNTTDGNR